MDNPAHADLHSTLIELSNAYRQRELDRYLDCFSPNPLVIGTGADERCEGMNDIRNHVKRDWAQSEHAEFALESVRIGIHGESAWVGANCRFIFCQGGKETSLAGRASFFLNFLGSRWTIAHAHFSLPAAGQAEGQSFTS